MRVFSSEYLTEPVTDTLYEAYVEAWTRYHKSAHQVDGHISVPATALDWKFVGMAVRAGNHSMNTFLTNAGLSRPNTFNFPVELKMWNSAKLEALRRLKL